MKEQNTGYADGQLFSSKQKPRAHKQKPQVQSSEEMPQALEASLSSHDVNLIDWCRLLRDRRWSQRQKYRLLKVLSSPEAIYASSDSQLKKIIGDKFRCQSAQVDEIDLDSDQQWLAEPGNHLITLYNPRFPDLLKQLSDPPIALFARGKLDLLDDPKVAIVGSRRPTPVGAKLVQELASDLANQGLVITSGMALGIDGMAHQAALANQGSTIAVMGCGLDIVYPSRNRKLHEQLSVHGLILSEYPLGYKPTRFTFPQRNRIVSGLSYGVLIVEAAQGSGTLITARLALDQDRELMVVPGSSLSSQYAGSHQLLKEGATLVTTSEDVLHSLEQPLQQYLLKSHTKRESHIEGRAKSTSFLNSQAQALLNYIGAESTSIDQIIRASGLSASEVSPLLLMLELDNIVTTDSDGGFINLS